MPPEAAVEIFGHRTAQQVAACTAGIAVNTDAALTVQNFVNTLIQLRRSRDGRIAEAEVEDIFRPDQGCLPPPVLKDLADRVGCRAQIVSGLVEHICLPPPHGQTCFSLHAVLSLLKRNRPQPSSLISVRRGIKRKSPACRRGGMLMIAQRRIAA
jgi:hypothetical protein